jgi:hypothetical protein
MDPEPNQFGIIHFATSLMSRPKQRSKLMNSTHTVELTKEELEVLVRSLQVFKHYTAQMTPQQKDYLPSAISRLEAASQEVNP